MKSNNASMIMVAAVLVTIPSLEAKILRLNACEAEKSLKTLLEALAAWGAADRVRRSRWTVTYSHPEGDSVATFDFHVPEPRVNSLASVFVDANHFIRKLGTPPRYHEPAHRYPLAMMAPYSAEVSAASRVLMMQSVPMQSLERFSADSATPASPKVNFEFSCDGCRRAGVDCTHREYNWSDLRNERRLLYPKEEDNKN